jgi:CheY-like chemotaxis protein
MFRALVLDDDDVRHAEFRRLLRGIRVVPARSAPEAIEILSRSPRFDVVFLDYDLVESSDPNPGTGLDVAEYIARDLPKRQRPDLVYVHSRTFHVGQKQRMARVLRDAGLRVTVKPFHL